MANPRSKEHHFDWPLTGKLITCVDPLLIGEGNFKALTNLRYTEKNVRGVQGMTAINAAPTTYTKIVNGHHFRKEQPAYDAVIAQTTSGGSSTLLASATPGNVPSADTFATLQTLNVNTRCNFSDAPNGAMVALNGDTNYIYGGPESPVGTFVNNAPDGSFRYDYTQQVNNTLSDASDVATLKSVAASIDANTMMLLHLDNNVTDSATSPNTVTNNNVTFSSSVYKFGGYAAQFNGTNAYLTVPDAAVFNFSGGTWTVDAWVYPTSLAGIFPVYYQNTTADADSFKISVGTDGSVTLLIKAASSAVVTLTTAAGLVTINNWYHIEAVESGSNYYIFVNGALVATTTDADRPANYTGVVQIGKDATVYGAGYVDELRVSNSARNTSAFTPMITAYGSTAQCYLAVIFTRALQGIKLYVKTPNASAATATAYVWNGASLAAVSSLVDGTAVGGKTLAQTGEISFASTVGTAQIRYAENTLGYYYYFVFSGIDATTSIYYCTVDAPIQALADIWDGSERAPAAAYIYTTSYSDVISNVSQREYSDLSALTYAQVGALTSSQYLYFGFADRLTAMGVLLPDSLYVQANGVVISLEYWNGSAWTSVGSLTDGTSISAKSFNKTGVISWQAPTLGTEFTTTVATSDPWYFYRLHFSGTLSADVRVDYVWGIPAPVQIRPAMFPVSWQDRLWLANDVTNQKNQMLSSAAGTNCVFNGSDSYTLPFGGDDAVVAAATLYSRFGSSLYDNMVVAKRSSTWLVDYIITGAATANSSAISQYKTYTISENIGCVAPLTMKTCDMSFAVAQGVSKHVVLWQSDRGIEMFDGNALATVSDDIMDFFDPTQPNAINLSQVATFSAFYDDVKYEYHWMCATGGSSTLNREMVFDLRRKRWYEVDRTSGKKINCGWVVRDSLGNKYVYGGTSDGYVERLEYGTAFDGQAITHTFEFGDVPLSKSLVYASRMRLVKLTGIAKNITSAKVAMTLYIDSAVTGLAIPSIEMSGTANRLYGLADLSSVARTLGQTTGNTHRLKFVVSTNNETIGFEPLMVSGFFETVREDWN